MIYIGCHLLVSEGHEAMGETMSRFGGNTFAWFTRNPRGGRSKPLVPEDVEVLLSHVRQEYFGPLVAHGSYTMNLCSPSAETRKGDRISFSDGGLHSLKQAAQAKQAKDSERLARNDEVNSYLKATYATMEAMKNLAELAQDENLTDEDRLKPDMELTNLREDFDGNGWGGLA